MDIVAEGVMELQELLAEIDDLTGGMLSRKRVMGKDFFSAFNNATRKFLDSFEKCSIKEMATSLMKLQEIVDEAVRSCDKTLYITSDIDARLKLLLLECKILYWSSQVLTSEVAKRIKACYIKRGWWKHE